MKYIKHIAFSLAAIMAFNSCDQETIELTDPQGPAPFCPADATAGSANFSKFVAIGTSFSAGFQSGALFTSGQNNSLPRILATSFECVGGPNTFNQPDIRTTYGYNIFASPNPDGTQVFGRYFLQGTPPAPAPYRYPALPNADAVGALPNPVANANFMYTGSAGSAASNALNNFSVPAILLGQALITETGDWAGAGADPRFSPFYARFASDGGQGTKTLLGDFIGSLGNNGTFFLFWLGMDDVLLHAVYGGNSAKAPLTPVDFVSMENPGFKALYSTAIGNIVGAVPTAKGVVGNIPDVFKLPHFNLVPYNAIPLDAATATNLTTNLANNYNAFLDGMVMNSIITQAEADKRKLTYVAGANAILINDETLTDLSPYMAGPYAGLAPYAMARQTTSADKIPLSAGSVLGKLADPGNPGSALGVAVPLGDEYALIPSEITAINDAVTAYNAHIKSVVDANDNLAFADIHAAFNTLHGAPLHVVDGVSITPNFVPPTGFYSEEGIHPNNRGYAFLARTFVSAINAKFGAKVPLPKLGNYSATSLPINP